MLKSKNDLFNKIQFATGKWCNDWIPSSYCILVNKHENKKNKCIIVKSTHSRFAQNLIILVVNKSIIDFICSFLCMIL